MAQNWDEEYQDASRDEREHREFDHPERRNTGFYGRDRDAGYAGSLRERDTFARGGGFAGGRPRNQTYGGIHAGPFTRRGYAGTFPADEYRTDVRDTRYGGTGYAMSDERRDAGRYYPGAGRPDWGSTDYRGSYGWSGRRHDRYGREYGRPGDNRARMHPDFDEDRDWMDRAGDEIRSWFGDEEAEERRRLDKYRGHGPKGYTRSDERIREDVCDRLTDDAFLDASDIELTVSEGEVTLAGTVSDRQAKRRAEDCADDVLGVRHVQNNLRVGTSPTTTPTAG